MVYLIRGGMVEQLCNYPMKKHIIYYFISALVTINLSISSLSNPNSLLTRRIQDVRNSSVSPAETENAETFTVSWNSFLKNIISDIFFVERESIVIPQTFSDELFTDLRINGPTTTSWPLKNMIQHVYYSIYNKVPAQNVAIAFCQAACEKMRKYKFVKFHEDDNIRTVSYMPNHRLLNSEREIDPVIIAMENDILKRQRANPFDDNIYKELVAFYRETIEFYPNRTRYYFHLAWALSGLNTLTDALRKMVFMESLSKEFGPIPLYISRFNLANNFKQHRQSSEFIVDWSSYRTQPLINRTENREETVLLHALKYAIQFPEIFQKNEKWITLNDESGHYTEDFLIAVKAYENRAKEIIQVDGVEIYGFWKDDILQYLALVPETGEVVGFRLRRGINRTYEVAIDTFYKLSISTVEEIRTQGKILFGESPLILLIDEHNNVVPPKDDLPDPLREHRQPEQIAEFNIFQLTTEMYQDGIALIQNKLLSQDGIGVLLVAGVSSAGKSPGTEIFCTRIESERRRTITLPMDMYYIDRDRMPTITITDPITGETTIKKDFDNPKALDIEHFKSDLAKLLNGEKVELPRYDFESGHPFPHSGVFLQLKQGDILVIEGIHALNPGLTGQIPEDIPTARIFIDAPRDIRLPRRILRDMETRGYSAIHTIEQWQFVTAAEDLYILPKRQNADVIIDTTPPEDKWLNSESYHKFVKAMQDAYMEAVEMDNQPLIDTITELLNHYGIEQP